MEILTKEGTKVPICLVGGGERDQMSAFNRSFDKISSRAPFNIIATGKDVGALLYIVSFPYEDNFPPESVGVCEGSCGYGVVLAPINGLFSVSTNAKTIGPDIVMVIDYREVQLIDGDVLIKILYEPMDRKKLRYIAQPSPAFLERQRSLEAYKPPMEETRQICSIGRSLPVH